MRPFSLAYSFIVADQLLQAQVGTFPIGVTSNANDTLRSVDDAVYFTQINAPISAMFYVKRAEKRQREALVRALDHLESTVPVRN